MSWRPKDWPKNPCDGCPDKKEDIYGLFCDLACGKATAYINREIGADAMLKTVRGQPCILGESLINTGAIGWKRLDPEGKWYFIPDEEVK